MKKIITILLITLTLLSILTLNVSANEIEYQINLSYEVERNTGIGEEFRVIYYVNGEEIEDGDILFLNKEDEINISADVTEIDDYPDEGKASGSVYLNEDDSTTTEVIYAELTEYMGRKNKGAEATINVIFEFVPQIEKTTTTNTTHNDTKKEKTLTKTIIEYVLGFTIGLYLIAILYFAVLFLLSIPIQIKYEKEGRDNYGFSKSFLITHIIPSGLIALSICILISQNKSIFGKPISIIYLLILIIHLIIIYIYYLLKLRK